MFRLVKGSYGSSRDEQPQKLYATYEIKLCCTGIAYLGATSEVA